MNIRIGSRGITGDGNEQVEPLDDIPLKQLEDPVVIQKAKECAFSAIMDGYTSIVYNIVRAGSSQLGNTDICSFKGFDLEKLWHEMSLDSKNSCLPKFKQLVRPSSMNLNDYITQSTRLTIVFETPSFIHNCSNLIGDSNAKTPIIDSYDLFALRFGKSRQKS
jgi:hypothetical protein